MRKKRRNNKFMIAVVSGIVILILLFISLNLDRDTNVLEDSLKNVTNAISKAVIAPLQSFNSKKGETQTESYTIQKNINESLEKEIQELKKELDLNKTFTEYETVNATILTRNKSYWFNTITIDKGKSSGLAEDMAVVTADGLVGKLTKVYRSSSEVKLITADDLNYKVSVVISTNDKDHYGVLSGYSKEEDLLKIMEVDKNSQIQKNDRVVTSGFGGVFPRGIYIGTVEKIEQDKYDLSKIIYIKTNQDFNNMHYVTVLKDRK